MAGSLNKVMLIGRLGKDPESRDLQQGGQIVTLNIATDDGYVNKMGTRVDVTTWHRVSVFGKPAQACMQFLKKGRMVYVEGKLLQNKFTDQSGNEKTFSEIRSTSIIFLSNGNGNVETKVRHNGNSIDYDETPF